MVLFDLGVKHIDTRLLSLKKDNENCPMIKDYSPYGLNRELSTSSLIARELPFLARNKKELPLSLLDIGMLTSNQASQYLKQE